MKLGILLALMAVAIAILLMSWSSNGRSMDMDASPAELDRSPLTARIEALEQQNSEARLLVLDEMIALGQTSPDPMTRTDVWRQLNHLTDPRLKRALLDSLALDSDGKTRAKAIDTMKDFLPDAQVEAALRIALQNDASPDVKAIAASLLARR